MIKRFLYIVLIMVVNMFTACRSDGTQISATPYTCKIGSYGYDKGVFTNLLTREITERSFDDIMQDEELNTYWGCLFGFSADICENTKFVSKDNRWFLLQEGLAFEVIVIARYDYTFLFGMVMIINVMILLFF